jgi:hypothetical protein
MDDGCDDDVMDDGCDDDDDVMVMDDGCDDVVQ